jgi:hypothetical protein
MNINTYIIIGAVATVFSVYLIILAKKSKGKNLKFKDSFIKKHNLGLLSKEKERLLTFGAILSYHRGEEILSIIPQTSLEQHFYGLRNQWEIQTTAEANETIQNLIALNRSQEYDAYLHGEDSTVVKIQKEIAKKLKIDLEQVQKTKSTFAWDILRAVSLAKWCFWCDYITQEEAWGYMNKSAEVASSMGDSWQDYTVSFLVGRTMQGFDLDDIYVEAQQLYYSKNPSMSKTKDVDVYQRFSFKA